MQHGKRMGVVAMWLLIAAMAWAGDAWRVSLGGLGPIRIEMPIDAALQQIRASGVGTVQEVVRQAEGEPYRHYDVMQSGRRLFTLEPAMNVVWRITIVSPDFKTSEGLGVGSPWPALTAAYPKLRVSPGAEGGACAVQLVPPGGLSFCFAEAKPAPTSRVQKVLLYSTSDL
ncbi:MAG: hypothetical protein HY696_01820 [Deltaproteobacteria bacterium]|nr:hypothetical protein [Deltaproteobacteria bacterium]